MSENLQAGVDQDGIVDCHLVETYYRPATSAYIDRENGFLAIVFDDGGIDGETRLPLSAFQDLGVEIKLAPDEDSTATNGERGE